MQQDGYMTSHIQQADETHKVHRHQSIIYLIFLKGKIMKLGWKDIPGTREMNHAMYGICLML